MKIRDSPYIGEPYVILKYALDTLHPIEIVLMIVYLRFSESRLRLDRGFRCHRGPLRHLSRRRHSMRDHQRLLQQERRSGIQRSRRDPGRLAQYQDRGDQSKYKLHRHRRAKFRQVLPERETVRTPEIGKFPNCARRCEQLVAKFNRNWRL